jgi:hypothetical protein
MQGNGEYKALCKDGSRFSVFDNSAFLIIVKFFLVDKKNSSPEGSITGFLPTQE